MVRLSQRAWNNILIFAMLFMVYLFSVGDKLLQRAPEESELIALLPEYSIIMSLEFSNLRIDRIGQDWRTSGVSDDESRQALINNLQQWQVLQVKPHFDVLKQNPFVVTMQLAGEEKQRVFRLYQAEEGAVIGLGPNNYLAQGVDAKELVFSFDS